MKAAGPYLEQFERLGKGTSQPGWVYPLRKAGMARFAEVGFPTTQEEDWRFTNVAGMSKLPFKPVFEAQEPNLAASAVAALTFGRLDCHRLTFVNGHFAPALSTPTLNEPAVVVQNLSRALAERPELLEGRLSKYARVEENSFTALNTAFFQDGGLVWVRAGEKVTKPVHLLFIANNAQAGATSQPRNFILAEPGSEVCVLESYETRVEGTYLTNAVTEVVAGAHAKVEHVKFQNESLAAYHLAAIHAHLGRGADVVLHSIAMGAKLSRNSIRTVLDGEGLECVLNGLYLTREDQLADHHMVVEHAKPHCASHEYYNGILDGRSKGVFHGRILVHQIAQKTDAKQTNKNLLLSDDATVDTKPQLEIYADDVKCTHGATVGQLHEESIFYLRSRGISAARARQMLIHAFAGEIIERIRQPQVREEMDRLVWDRLEANPHVAQEAIR